MESHDTFSDDANLIILILDWVGIPTWLFAAMMFISIFLYFPRFILSILSLLFAYYIYWGISLEKNIIKLFENQASMPISLVLQELGLGVEDRKDCKPLSWGPGPICKVYDNLDKLLNERRFALSDGTRTATKKEQVVIIVQ